MKNFLGELPTDPIFGRSMANTKFCELSDISGKRILEVGCGFGWFCKFAEDNRSTYIHGIDLNSENIAMLSEFFSDSKSLKFSCCVVDEISEDEKYDTVVAWEVLEHLPKGSEINFFNKLNTLLKINGVFYMSTPNSTPLSNIFDPAWILTGHRHYTLDELTNFADLTGFKLQKAEVLGGWWEIFYIFNLYISKWVFRRHPFFLNKFKDYVTHDFCEKGFTNIFVKFSKYEN